MSDRFTQYFHSLKDKKIAVLGLGVSKLTPVSHLLTALSDIQSCSDNSF